MNRNQLKIILGCLAAYILILFRHGYIFGSGDQSEMLPYAKYLADNSLYSKDFYVQSIAAYVPNERFVFSKLLSYCVPYLPELTFGLHALGSFFLILGLHRLAKKWLTTEGGQWIATLAPILILYNIHLGGNELYYNTLTPSYLAQVIGLWAFVLVFEGYTDFSYGLIFLTTFIHPLIGVQLWLLVAATNSISKFYGVAYESWRAIFLINLGYLLTAGFYIFKIKSGYDAGNISSDAFLNIIEFRAPHHYFPNYFPLKHWLILMALFVVYFLMSQPLLRLVIGIILTGCAVYAFGVLVLKSPTIMSTQWFSMTIWLKTFSIMAIIGLIESFIEDNKRLEKIINSNLIFNCLIVFSLVSVIFMTPQYKLFKNKNYDFLTAELIKTPEIDISLKAKELTDKNAVFLIPSDFSAFRYWSERNIFIDYKATNHRQAAFAEWYKRVQNVYAINLEDRLRNADLPFLANENYKRLKENDFLQFAKKSRYYAYFNV
ncbi:MAG: DUF6798 domain-containing protein [Saprospiraceae bacterium]|nr:DUF6798 domain-containing protein [Saprospiraceae bacterium]